MSRDVVFTFAFTAWSGALQRGLCFPEDRLALALGEHPQVRRALVCDPFRSLPLKLARDVMDRRNRGPAPEALYRPVRLRRSDPVSLSAIRRACAAYERGMRRAAARRGLDDPAVITANPLLAGFGSFEWAGPVTYYAWDDWTAFEPHRRWWRAYEAAFERLRAHGRRVVAVSEAVLDAVAPTGPAAVVPNGIEPAEWDPLPPAPAWFTRLPRPRLLYVGSLQGRVDVEALAACARAHPEGSVVLVGPMQDPEHFAALRALPNVLIRPPAARAEACGLIGAADACLIPHVRSRLTEAMSPLKLYEYLAGGRPIAAVDLPPIRGVDPRVVLAEPGGDFAAAVARALDAGPAPESERRRAMAAHAWTRRHDAILALALPDSVRALPRGRENVWDRFRSGTPSGTLTADRRGSRPAGAGKSA